MPEFYMTFAQTINKIPEFYTIYARKKINKIPEFYRIYARKINKMPEFYMIFPDFLFFFCPPAPQSPTPMSEVNRCALRRVAVVDKVVSDVMLCLVTSSQHGAWR